MYFPRDKYQAENFIWNGDYYDIWDKFEQKLVDMGSKHSKDEKKYIIKNWIVEFLQYNWVTCKCRNDVKVCRYVNIRVWHFNNCIWMNEIIYMIIEC